MSLNEFFLQCNAGKWMTTYNIQGDVNEDQVAAYFGYKSEYYYQSKFPELQ